MKIFTLLHNSNVVGTVLPGLKSRITSTKPVLALLLLLMVGGWNSEAWGYSSTQLTVNISGGGKVAVTTSNSAPSSYSSSSVSVQQGPHGMFETKVKDTYYVWVSPNSGYSCSGVTDGTLQSNGAYKISFAGSTFTTEKTVTATFVADFYGRADSYSSPSNGGGTYVSCNGNTPSQASQYITHDKSTFSKTGQTSAPACSAYFAALASDGYEFVGWYTGENGTGTIKSADISYTENISIAATSTSSNPTSITRYAYFKPLQYYYFKAQANKVGNGTVYASFTNSSFTSTTDTKSERAATLAQTQSTITPTAYFKAVESDGSYHFAGWYTDAACTEANRVSTDLEYSVVMGKSNKTSAETALTQTLYAKFVQELTPEISAIGYVDANPKTMKVGDNIESAFSFLNTSSIGSGLTVASSNTSVLVYDAGLNKISAVGEGTATITFTQSYTGIIKAKTFTFNFSVSRVENTLALNTSSDTKYVGQEVTNVLKDESINSDATIETSSTDATIAYYDVKNDKIVIDNSGNNPFTSTTVTIKIWQAKNVKYTASEEKTFTLTVKKHVPTFTLNKTTLELDQTATLSMTDVDEAVVAIEPATGVITYAEGTVTAVGLGSAKLTVTQPETRTHAYKQQEFDVKVIKKTPSLSVKLNNTLSTSLTLGYNTTATFGYANKVSDAEVVVEQVDGTAYVTYANGTFTTYYGAGTAHYKAVLPETDTYQRGEFPFSITVNTPNDYLPVSGKSYTIGSGSATDWTHHYETLHFNGIPDKLSFNYAYIYTEFKIGSYDLGEPSLKCPDIFLLNGVKGAARGEGNVYMLYVEESADGSNWTKIWDNSTPSKSSVPSGDIQLNKDTRYIRFHHSSNFSNTYSNITITELKYVENPVPSNIDFGKAALNAGEVSETALINWCNIAPLTVTSSNPRFSVSPETFGNYLAYGSQELTISYTHTNEGGAHEGDITITNGVYTKTIHVTAETTKYPQEIIWNDQIAATGFAMNVGESYPDETIGYIAAVAREDAEVTFTSANSSIIAVEEGKLVAKAVGSVEITAHQAGDEEYQEVSSTKTFVVTNLQKQTITWNQNLLTLLTTSGTVGLTATASSGGAITYASANESVVRVEGNVLTVVGEGETTITATQAGGNIGGVEYMAISQQNNVIVRNPASQCSSRALSVGSLELSNSKKSQDYTLSGIPERLTFKARHDTKTGSWGTAVAYSELIVEQYAHINNVWDWYEVFKQVVGTSDGDYSAGIDETATKLRFRTNESAKHTISSINVTNKKFMRTDAEAVDMEIEANAIWSKKITVSHSNIDYMTITSKKGLIELSTTTLGEGCGDFGDDDFTATFTPLMKYTHYYDTIVITDSKAQPTTIEIPVHFYTKGLNQSILGFVVPETCASTDLLTPFNATASTGLPIAYHSSDSTIAYVDAENRLFILSSGTVSITARQDGDNKYDMAEQTKSIVITKVTPAIATVPNVETIKYLDNLNNNQLSGGKATVTLRGVPDTEVAGAFEWTEKPQVVAPNGAGDYTHSITFKPSDTGMYNDTVFDQTIAISRADASIVMNDGAVKVKIDGINDVLDEYKIDLDTLIASQTTDNIAVSRAGAVSYKVLSANNAEYATIDGDHVFAATRCDEYTIEVTKAQTDWYVEAKDTFKVTVEKLQPVVIFDNTDDPQAIYTYDELRQPAARWYNGHEISRVIVYTSEDQEIVEVNKASTVLTAKEVPNKDEGEYSDITVSAYSVEDDFYNESAVTEKHYAVHAKRSPVFELDGVENAPVSKILNIGETAIIRYNEFTDGTLTVTTSGEHGYVSFTLNREAREVTVTAVKGNLTGDGTQIITLNQPGNDDYYGRQINYTFTVQRNVSTMSLDPLPANMNVEDTVSTIFTNLANTDDAIQFSCTPAGGLKMEDGKLIALQAGPYTVSFTQPNTEYWTEITQSKTITVSKINPQITWFEETSQPWYASIRNPFTSANTMNDCPITVTSSDETLAKYIAEDNKIVVYGKSGTVTFTLNQPGNYKYNPVVNATKTFTVFKPNNGLPFTLTSSNWTNYKNSNEGAISWTDGGIVCGSASYLSPGNWNAKYVVLSFTGIPDSLFFDFKNTSLIATQYGWHFYQSSTGDDDDWHVLAEYADALMNSDGGTSEGSERLALNPDTRYVRLEYHGNYGGSFKNVSVTERKEIAPQRATEDFGLGYNGNEPTDHIIPIDWYNVNSCRVYIDGANADRFVLSENTIYSNLNEYGTANLHVSYKHDANTVTPHTATLHIVEEKPDGTDGLRTEVTLVGETQPAPQVIVWREDLTPMPSEGEFTGAAYSTSGLEITLTSLNTDIVRVGGDDGLTLYPVAAGIAQVQAYQAGNEKWAEVTEIIEIEVTNKQVQFITWDDNLSNLKREDGKTVTVTLNATATSGLEVTYELDEAASAFASVNGNKLTLIGWGTGTITAVQAGNDDYVAVRKKKTLVSRNPNAGCRPLVGEYADEYTLHTIAFKEIELNGEPQSIEFDAKCDALAVNGLLVAEFYDNYWHEIARIKRLEGNTLTSSYKHFGPYDLHRSATAVKIYTETGATFTRTFKNVEVTLAKYLELERNEMNFSQMDMGSTKIQSFYINYSNLTGALDVQLETPSDQFEVITTAVGEDCGDYAKNVCIEIKCTGKTAGIEENAIIVSNINQTLRVPVSANVLKPTQAITWEPETNILTTDEVTLSATATSELAVIFESKQPEIADVVWNGETWELDIKKYGDVTITASQAGNESWSAATDKNVIFHISRIVPEITEYPTADAIMLSFPLGSCALHGGAVANEIAGTFRWADEEQIVTRETNIYQAMFAPENQNYYAPVLFDIELEVIEDTQYITWDREEETYAHCADVIALEAVASSGLPITYHSSDSLVAYVENGVLKVIQSGTVTIQATQTGNIRYAAAEPVSKQITLERNTLEVVDKPTASYVYVNHNLSDAVFENNGVVKAGDIVVEGTFTWETDEMMPTLGTYSRNAIFTPNNTNWYIPTSCSVNVQVISAYIYTGDGEWTLNKDYWHDGKRPDGGYNEDDIAVAGTLRVTDEVTIKVRDLNVSGTLILEEGASMTVTGNLILEASLGGSDETTLYPSTSGQLIGSEIADSLKVAGDVYFQMTFDPNGVTLGWYDFVVPFEVDVLGGIYEISNLNTPLRNGVDYIVMSYDESKYAMNGKYWNRYTGTMLPGRVYTITIDDEHEWKTLAFKKKKGAAITGDRSFTPSYTASEDIALSGWNGFGNGTLRHASMPGDNEEVFVQIYDHTNHCYHPYDVKAYNIAVGTSFFVQVGNTDPIVLAQAQNTDRVFAPARQEHTAKHFRLAFSSENDSRFTDHLWVSADEEATNNYEIGHDLLKLGTPSESKVAQVWTNAYGHRLCDIEMPLVNKKAECDLGIYAPKAGTYTLSIESAPENEMLFLTYNGRAIWNLSMSSYTFDMNQGTTEGYGLRIVKTSQTATDIKGAEAISTEVRKVLINDNIYIITPDGAMYDVTGKKVE